MDQRKALPQGTVLHFPGIACELGAEIGRGSNALVYEGSYRDALDDQLVHRILVKELFPLEANGKIYRDGADGLTVRVEPEGEAAFLIHRNSFEAGNKAHLTLLEACPDQIGANLNTFALNGTLYTLLGVSGGRSLGKLQPTPALSLRQCADRILAVLDALDAFHRNGLAHLDIAPDNILLLGSGHRERALLIDYNSAMAVSLARQSDAPVFSVKQGYTAPEIRSGRTREIGFASDLYSVAAVFYRLLAGAPLTPFQMIRSAPPDVSGCPCVREEPETVRVWVQEILRRGLQTIPGRRYQSVGRMRQDLEELIDRIEGIGITHWALWEAGRRNAEQMVRENPSLAFLRNSADLFPSMVTDGSETFPAESRFRDMPENCMLLAGGGMGKTTALLRLSLSGRKKYSPDSPAVIYLSLYGWQPGENNYILNRLLDGLRFHADTRTFEDARKVLQDLLRRPLETPAGTRPALLLLLDGLNEAAGDIKPLLDEIRSLSSLAGLRLIVASRAEEAALPFPALRLAELTEDVVQQAVGKAGLLLPESPDLQELLRTPLMLSMYLASGDVSGQLRITAARDLLQAYLSALKEKAVRDLPEGTDRRWQIDAAVELVLPALAAEIGSRSGALDDRRLLPVVEKCWRLLNGRLSRRFFPQWIGHTAAIRGSAKNAEEWYGQIVHELLWKQLGLLVRDNQGRYLIMHQMIAEFLLDSDRKNTRKVRRYRRTRLLIAALCLCALAVSAVLVWRNYLAPEPPKPPEPYNEKYADNIMAQAADAYVYAGSQYAALQRLTASAADHPESFSNEWFFYERSLPYQGTPSARSLPVLSALMQSGEVMPWSGEPMDEKSCRDLLTLGESRQEEYDLYADVLHFVMTDDYGFRNYGAEYPRLLAALLETDAEITANLYQIVCLPHLTGKYADQSTLSDSFRHLIAAVPEQNAHLDDETAAQSRMNLQTLEGARQKDLEKLRQCGAFHAYEKSLEEKDGKR